MNRIEFFEALSKELSAREISGSEEILADFEAHFDEAIRAGQSEEEVTEMLGDISEIAEQCAEVLTDPLPESAEDKQSGEGGIYLKISSANVVIEPNTGSDFDVNIKRVGIISGGAEGDEDFEIEQAGNTVRVIQRRYASIVTRLLSVMEIKTVHIGVPAAFCGEINVNLFSGNVTIDNISNASTLSAEVTSGNLKVIGLSSGKMKAKSRSGNIKLENCVGDLVASCSSGSIQVKEHSGNVSASSFSGNVTVETDLINHESTFSTKSGNVKLALNRLESNMELTCTSGNVQFKVYELHGNITAKTFSGNVTGYLRDGTKADFRLNSSGAKNEFENNVISSEIPCVALSSRSGSVRLKKL